MRLFKPAQFFAMRAIGKQAHRVVLNGAQNQQMNAIEHLVRRCECAYRLRSAVYRLPAQAHYARPCRALHLNVTESVVAESRMPGFNALADLRAACKKTTADALSCAADTQTVLVE